MFKSFALTLLTQSALSKSNYIDNDQDPSNDISTYLGNTKWWNTENDLSDFVLKAQDPTFSYHGTMSVDMRAEHIYNSVVEAQYLIDTNQ